MRRFLLSLATLVVLESAAFALDPAEYEKRLPAIRVPPEHLRWQEIPWMTDLAEGMRLAKEENRPLLLWIAVDEPLERC
jgi:hypothetical protein